MKNRTISRCLEPFAEVFRDALSRKSRLVPRPTYNAPAPPRPTASLLKALLINGAVQLAGIDRNEQGFGRVDLQVSINNALAIAPNGGIITGSLALADNDTQNVIQEMEIAGGGRTFKASLVYTDYPGAALHHNINLIVRVAGQECHGNMGAGAGFDNANNVEQVLWENIPPGSYASHTPCAAYNDGE